MHSPVSAFLVRLKEDYVWDSVLLRVLKKVLFFGILKELLEYRVLQADSAEAAVLAKITSVCAKIYGLSVTNRCITIAEEGREVTKCGKRFFKECVLLNNNRAIP